MVIKPDRSGTRSDFAEILAVVLSYIHLCTLRECSGGAIFIRDPHRKVSTDQLNGGRLTDFAPKDWDLILPYLKENEELFGISIERNLLTV
jgi:hypothetical protein